MPSYVITGANRGLGLEFSRQLASDPSNTLFLTTRSLSSDLDDLKSVTSSKKNVHILECDVSSLSSIQAFGKEVAGIVGKSGGKIDFLLNNAGINSVPNELSLSITPEGLSDQITTNVLGPAKSLEALLPHLSSGSVVLNMTSGLGSLTNSLGSGSNKCTTYSISKAALNMLTVHQSIDLREKGITVICMDPGWVQTRMGGEGAILTPEESITGMLKTVHKVGLEESGKFYTYTGKEVGW